MNNSDVTDEIIKGCEYYHNLDPSEWCQFSNETSSCHLDKVFVQYIDVILCSERAVSSNKSWIVGMNVLYTLWAIYLFLALGITADAFLVPTLTRISDNLRLSDNVAGVTLVALGNGAPDIFSAVAAFTATDDSVATMAIGSLLGAGMFVIMIVSGVCMIIKPFETACWSSLRDIITYLWALFWLTQCIYKGRITLYDAIGFLVLYALYVILVFLQDRFLPDEIPEIHDNEYKEDGSSINPASSRLPDIGTVNSIMFKNRIRAMTNLSEPKSMRSYKSNRSLNVPNQTDLPGVDNLSYIDIPVPAIDRLSHELSPTSTISFDGRLRPFAKNRIRAMTQGSTVDVKPDKVSRQPSYYSEHMQPEDIAAKTWRSEIIAALTPFDPEEFYEGGSINKFISLLMSPLYICLKLSCPVLHDRLEVSWNKPLALLQAASYPWLWYILLRQYLEKGFGATEDSAGFPRYACAIIGSVVMMSAVAFTSFIRQPPVYYHFFVYASFFSTVLWIYIEANEVVGLLTALGFMWNIASTIMGLTFLAWANSVGDLVADVSLARIGKARTAVAACFGTPLLNLLVGVGMGCTMGILTIPERRDGILLILDELNMALAGGVAVILILLLIVLPLVNFRVSKYLGITQIIIYLIFLVLCILAAD